MVRKRCHEASPLRIALLTVLLFCHSSSATYELFNDDLSRWNTAAVISMRGMFAGARSFNSDVGMWNVGNVETFSAMFAGAQAFDRDLNLWTVTASYDMYDYLFST